ncbi:MAG: hypothetical protein RLY17_384, partial [Pseudomonadota bacterium]
MDSTRIAWVGGHSIVLCLIFSANDRINRPIFPSPRTTFSAITVGFAAMVLRGLLLLTRITDLRDSLACAFQHLEARCVYVLNRGFGVLDAVNLMLLPSNHAAAFLPEPDRYLPQI